MIPSKLKYKCPVCQKPLTKKEFDRALRIHEARQEHVEHQAEQLAKDRRAFEAHKKAVTKQAREAERNRSRRLLAGKDSLIRVLCDRMRQLQQGKTPQEEGPEFEVKLVKRLRAEFQSDDVQQTPRSTKGDVLHIVNDGAKLAGAIIYECKGRPSVKGGHIRQTAQAKMSRRADFAVLVTNGKRRGFGGLAEVSGVLIVAPAGVIPLAALLRNHLIEMLRAGIEKKRRAKIANQLLKFIKSTEFRNPIEEVVRTAEDLKQGIEDEYWWHVNDWKKRLNAYEKIRWDSSSVQENVKRVFRGEVPKQMIQPRQKLALPAAPLAGEIQSVKVRSARTGSP